MIRLRAELKMRLFADFRSIIWIIHYGRDEGFEMAVAYHSVISTVKLHGMSCWDFLGNFFQIVSIQPLFWRFEL